MQHNDIAIISDMRVEKVQKHNCKRCGYERRLPRTTISLFFVNIVYGDRGGWRRIVGSSWDKSRSSKDSTTMKG